MSLSVQRVQQVAFWCLYPIDPEAVNKNTWNVQSLCRLACSCTLCYTESSMVYHRRQVCGISGVYGPDRSGHLGAGRGVIMRGVWKPTRGSQRLSRDVAHVPDLFSAATTPSRFLALCALAEADAATASSGAPLRGEGMQEATDKLYSEAYLTLLLRTVSSDGISPRLAVELALVLRHADQQIVPATLVVEFTQAVLASVDPQRAINHLLRYLDNVSDIAAFWATVVQYPAAFIGMMRLFASSQLLSSILWRRPQLLFWLLEGALWAPPPPPAMLAADLTQLLAGIEEEGEVATILRTFTQQHLLRIGARDLCGLASVEETTADLSALADCVIQAGLEACVRWLTALYGVPMYTDADGVQHPCGFCVIGMGKLGGYELNFASDVDLMYVYTSYEGSTSGLGATVRSSNRSRIMNIL